MTSSTSSESSFSKTEVPESSFTFSFNSPQPTNFSTNSDTSGGSASIPKDGAAIRKQIQDRREKRRRKASVAKEKKKDESQCLDQANHKVVCVVCGGSGSSDCKGIENRDAIAWLDDWMIIKMTPATERCTMLGPGKIRSRGPYNQIWLDHLPIKIDAAYNRNHGACHRPVHKACFQILERNSEYSASVHPHGPKNFLLPQIGGRVFDILRGTPNQFISDSSSQTVRFNNGCGKMKWHSEFDIEDPQTAHLAADPSFLSLEMAMEYSKDDAALKDKSIKALDPEHNSEFDIEIVKGKGRGKVYGDGGLNRFAALPTELIHSIGYHVINLSGKQPWTCESNWKEEKRERTKKRKASSSSKDEEAVEDDGENEWEDEESSEEVTISDEDGEESSDSDDGGIPKPVDFKKIFLGEKSLLAWRATSRFMYHFSFDKSVWKRLVVARSQRFGPFSYPPPLSFYEHRCGQTVEDNDANACTDGFVTVKNEFSAIPSHSHSSHPPPASTRKHHWLKQIEKETIEMVKKRDELDAEEVYRALAGLHSLRNAERIIAGWEDFENRVMRCVVAEEMYEGFSEEEDLEDEEDDMNGMPAGFPNPFFNLPPGMVPLGGGDPFGEDGMGMGEMMGAVTEEILGSLFAELFSQAHHHHHYHEEGEDSGDDVDSQLHAFFEDGEVEGDAPDADEID